jgi:predicted transcriptional regulator
MSDPRALLIVLLAKTGLTQSDTARLLGVSSRT